MSAIGTAIGIQAHVTGTAFTSGDIDAIGLCLDIIGAFFLAQGFVMKRREEIGRETRSYYDGNPFLLRSATQQAVEARVGFVFLALGFLGQLISQLTWFSADAAQFPIEIGIGSVAVFAAAATVTRTFKRRLSQRVVAAEWGASMSAAMVDVSDRSAELARTWAPALDLKIVTEDSDAELSLIHI